MDDNVNKKHNGDGDGDDRPPRIILHMVELRHPDDPRGSEGGPPPEVLEQLLAKMQELRDRINEEETQAVEDEDHPAVLVDTLVHAIKAHGEHVRAVADSGMHIAEAIQTLSISIRDYAVERRNRVQHASNRAGDSRA